MDHPPPLPFIPQTRLPRRDTIPLWPSASSSPPKYEHPLEIPPPSYQPHADPYHSSWYHHYPHRQHDEEQAVSPSSPMNHSIRPTTANCGYRCSAGTFVLLFTAIAVFGIVGGLMVKAKGR